MCRRGVVGRLTCPVGEQWSQELRGGLLGWRMRKGEGREMLSVLLRGGQWDIGKASGERGQVGGAGV